MENKIALQKITTNLWFANEAEEAVNFYLSVFKNSKLGRVSHYTEAGFETHHMPAGTVLTMEFQLEGKNFVALNGGPLFKFNESVSFIINCENQEEIDYYWEKLTQGGDKNSQMCGWLKDKYGLSWQVVPTELPSLLTDKDPGRANAVMNALLKMKKLDVNALKEAAKKQRVAG